MIKINLKDPGMHDKVVRVDTVGEIDGVLEQYNSSYTLAIVCNLEMEGSIAMVYRRELGEREWVCCTREELRWT